MCWQGPGGAVSCPRGWVARGLTDLGLTGPLVCCRSWAGSAQRGYVSGKAVGGTGLALLLCAELEGSGS